MKPELYTRVVLVRDLGAEGLCRGDLAWVVDYLDHPMGNEAGAVLEIFNVLGESLRVVTVPVSAIAPAQADQVPAVRELAVA
jgi:ABC-type hemin transport system substrate-binding protein